jgi:hypothetical protein
MPYKKTWLEIELTFDKLLVITQTHDLSLFSPIFDFFSLVCWIPLFCFVFISFSASLRNSSKLQIIWKQNMNFDIDYDSSNFILQLGEGAVTHTLGHWWYSLLATLKTTEVIYGCKYSIIPCHGDTCSPSPKMFNYVYLVFVIFCLFLFELNFNCLDCGLLYVICFIVCLKSSWKESPTRALKLLKYICLEDIKWVLI